MIYRIYTDGDTIEISSPDGDWIYKGDSLEEGRKAILGDLGVEEEWINDVEEDEGE